MKIENRKSIFDELKKYDYCCKKEEILFEDHH
jgi:hypothetical protein